MKTIIFFSIFTLVLSANAKIDFQKVSDTSVYAENVVKHSVVTSSDKKLKVQLLTAYRGGAIPANRLLVTAIDSVGSVGENPGSLTYEIPFVNGTPKQIRLTQLDNLNYELSFSVQDIVTDDDGLNPKFVPVLVKAKINLGEDATIKGAELIP